MGNRAITEPLALTTDYVSIDGRYTDANGNPYASVAAAEAALGRRMNQYTVGLTVLVKESGWAEAKEYWVQPYETNGVTAYHLVKKGGEDLTKALTLSGEQKYYASANVNDRPADVVIETGVVKALGYKVLNPNLSFAEQVNSANTIYEIKDSFDLGGGNVTIPTGCTLKFNGGKLVNGTIDFNGCFIDSLNVPIFGTDMEFTNVNVKNTELIATWFGFTPQNTDVTQLNKIIAFGCNVFIPKGEYLLTSTIEKTTSENITNIYGESRATILRSTTCDIFNVKYTRIESFQIKAEGYYGIKVNGSYVKVIDNDIRRCAVGVGNEFTMPNKMENEVSNNTIQYCTDSGIKYIGSSPVGGYGYISGLKIHDNYIVKAGTGVDDYTAPGTEGFGYGIYIENIYAATVEKNVCEYCSFCGIYVMYSDYQTTGLFVINNGLEQNKRAQIVLDISTDHSSIRGLEIRENRSSYPFAKVSNFINEYAITKTRSTQGTGAYGLFTLQDYTNKAFGFDRNNSFGKNINTLYKNVSKLSDLGANTLSHPLTDNGIEFYKGETLSSLPLIWAEQGIYRIKYSMKRTTTPTGGTDVPSGFLDIVAKCKNDKVNMTYSFLTTAMGVKIFNAFIKVNTAGPLYISAYIESGSALPEDMPLFTVSDLSVEKYSLSAVTRSSIRGMYSDLKGLSIFDDSLDKVISYNGTAWVEEDGEVAGIRRTGTSNQRPTPTNIGFKYFDTSLGKPIYWNGSAWTDANGETVGLQVNDTTILLAATASSSKTINVYSSSAITATTQNPDGSITDLWLTTNVGTLTNGAYPVTLTATSANSTNPRGAKVIISNGTDVVIVNVVQNYV